MEGRFDEFSYRCGVIDSFCEMVAAGNKPLALSHPFRDGADRARYLPHCRAMAEQYGILFREEDALPVTPLFPRAAVDGVKVVLFAEDGEVWRRYQAVKDLADPAAARLRRGGHPPEDRGQPVGVPLDFVNNLQKKSGSSGEDLPASGR